MSPTCRDGCNTGALCPPVRRPEAMSPDQRTKELAAILARAYLRLAALRDPLDSSGVPGASCEPVDSSENNTGKGVE